MWIQLSQGCQCNIRENVDFYLDSNSTRLMLSLEEMKLFIQTENCNEIWEWNTRVCVGVSFWVEMVQLDVNVNTDLVLMLLWLAIGKLQIERYKIEFWVLREREKAYIKCDVILDVMLHWNCYEKNYRGNSWSPIRSESIQLCLTAHQNDILTNEIFIKNKKSTRKGKKNLLKTNRKSR